MPTEPLDDDYRMPLNPKPHYCSQCDNEVGEDETLCLECREEWPLTKPLKVSCDYCGHHWKAKS